MSERALEPLETDVLVVGGGGAGCRAAIEASDLGADVLMIVKGRLGHSGCTLNVGISSAVGPWGDPSDSNDSSMRDLLAYGGFLGDQDLARILVEESPDRVQEMERWGIDFDREADGSISVMRDTEHTHARSFFFKPGFLTRHDYGSPPGIAMMGVLMREVGKRSIRVSDDVMLVDLLTTDGRVVGATALDCRAGEIVAIKARSVVLATGSFSQIFDPTTVSLQETGDGHAAAYRAGAELIDMENTQFVATDIGFGPESVFLNADREEFLPRYGIDGPGAATKERLTYAVWKEIREGRGTKDEKVYVDVAGAHRVDPAAARLVETAPRAHTTTGGVRTDERCRSTLPGLYAAGAVAGGVYGHARPQGYTSMITLVFGRRAGLFAAQDSERAPEPVLDDSQVRASIRRATDLVERSAGARPREIKSQLRSITRRHAWVIKEGHGLSEGLAQIKEVRDMMRVRAEQATFRARPKDGFEWADFLEVPNMLATAGMMLACALERTESRGAFFRDDYPETDNDSWLKNIVCKSAGDGLALSTVPVGLKYFGPAEPARFSPPATEHPGR